MAFRGSWNRDRGTGYKIVFVPFDDSGTPEGYYEDFLTGFLLQPGVPTTWRPPVGVRVMPDGSVLFTEEGNNRIYRVQYDGNGNYHRIQENWGESNTRLGSLGVTILCC